jgi:hypothetical protein
MEAKWAAIFVIVLISVPAVGVSFSEYQHNQCRIEAIKAGVEADKINTACGVR